MSDDTTPPPGLRARQGDLADRLRTYGQGVLAASEHLVELLDTDEPDDLETTTAHTLLRKLLQGPEVYYRLRPGQLTVDGHITGLTEQEAALAQHLIDTGDPS